MYERNYKESEDCRNDCVLEGCAWLWGQDLDDYDINDDAFSKFCQNLEAGYDQGISDGHLLVYAYPAVTGKDTFPNILEAANFGDERAQYYIAREYREDDSELAFAYFLKGAQQKHKDCMYKVARYYEKGRGCKQDLLKAAEYFVKGMFMVQIPDRMCFAYREQHWNVLYVYANACDKNMQLQYMVEGAPECIDAMNMYRMAITIAKDSIFCFTLICRRYGFLSKDMRKMVGQIIWESRKNLGLWVEPSPSQKTKKIKIK
jgi:hypothetical protein